MLSALPPGVARRTQALRLKLQAQRLAAEMQQMQRTLELLTLGTAAAGRVLLSVNTDDGTLTFAEPA